MRIGSTHMTRRRRLPGGPIARRKDGSTHMAHQGEHAVDLAAAAIVAVTLPSRRTRATRRP
jgi:hypothetical protein